MPNVFFMHIPKTGGNSVTQAVADAVGARNTCGSLEPNCDSYLAAYLDWYRHQYGFGHVDHKFCTRWLSDWRWVTLIRHPVDRIISLHAQLKRQKNVVGFNCDITKFDDFINSGSPQVSNDMSRRIGGKANLSKFALVGSLDMFEDFLTRLASLMEVRELDVLHKNVSNFAQRVKVTRGRERQILKLNQEDLELYEEITNV